MAELIEDQHLFFHHRDGVVVAGLGTLAAPRATGLVPDRLGDFDRFSAGEFRLDEQVVVRFFHVAVQEAY